MLNFCTKNIRFKLHSAILLLLVFAVVIASPPIISEKLLSQVRTLYGNAANNRLLDWLALMDSYAEEDEMEKLVIVNNFFNKMRFVNDIDHWGREDYWATPVEFLASSAGDCEDFSIAKYYTLKMMGVPVDRLRITYVKALRLNQAHMVVTYYPTQSSVPLVLDNLNGNVLPASKREDLLPVYSFNADGLWLAKSRTKGLKVGKVTKIRLWDDLVMRIDSEMVNKAR